MKVIANELMQGQMYVEDDEIYFNLQKKQDDDNGRFIEHCISNNKYILLL